MDRTFALPLPRTLRLPRRIALPRRRLLGRLVAALLALPVLGGGWLWLRDSPLVAVEHVQVLGAHGPGAHAVEAALREAGLHMTTLHVNVAALQAAVAPLRVVRAVRVSTAFPHTLRVRVIEQPPVAAMDIDGVRTAVAADGAVLGPALLAPSLPSVPASGSDRIGARSVQSEGALAALSVLGAAPPTLAGWIARVYSGREGLTVAMRNGLLIYFGDASRPHAKWAAAARVLADSSSAGAYYVDVRLPERPAAGISGGPAGTGSSTASTGVSASDPTAASLAESLAAAIGGSAGTGASTPASTTSAAPAVTATPTATGTSEAAAATPAASTASPTASTSAPATTSETPTTTAPTSEATAPGG